MHDGDVWGTRPKLRDNCAFPQNFRERKLDEITLFYAANNRCKKFIAFSSS